MNMGKASDSVVLPKRAVSHVLSTMTDIAVESKRRAEILVSRAEQYCGLQLPFPIQYVAMASISCVAITTAFAARIGELGQPRKDVLRGSNETLQHDKPQTTSADSNKVSFPTSGSDAEGLVSAQDLGDRELLEASVTVDRGQLDKLNSDLDSGERERHALQLRVEELETLLSTAGQTSTAAEANWRVKHESLSTELDVLRNERQSISEQHIEGLQTLQNLNTELSHLKSTTLEQTNMLDDLNSRILARDDELSKLRLQITSEQEVAQKEHSKLQTEIQEKARNAKSLELAIEASEKTNIAQKQEHDSERRELETKYQTKIDQHVQSIEQTQLDYSEEMQSTKSLHDAEMADLVESHEAELEYMKRTIDAVRNQLTEASNLAETKSRESSQAQSEHQREVSELQSQYEGIGATYKERLSKAEANLSEQQKIQEALKVEVRDLKDSLQDASHATESIRTEKMSYENSSSSRITQLLEELTALEKSLDSKNIRNNELEASVLEFEKTKTENTQLKEMVAAKTKATTELDHEVDRLKSVLQDKTSQLDGAHADHQLLQAHISQVTTDHLQGIEAMKGSNSALQDKASQLDKVHAEYELLQTHLSAITTNHTREREALEQSYSKVILEKDETLAEIARLQKTLDSQAVQGVDRSESEVSLLKIVNRNSHGDLLTSRNSQGELKASIKTNRETLSPIAIANRRVPTPFTEGASKFSEHLGSMDDDSHRDYEEETRVREYTERMLIGASNSRRQPYIPGTNMVSDDEERGVSGGSAKIVSPKTPSTTAFDHASTAGVMTPSSPRQAPPIPNTSGSGSHHSGSTTPTRRQSGFKRLFRRASAKFNSNNNSASASPQSMTEIMNNGVLHK